MKDLCAPPIVGPHGLALQLLGTGVRLEGPAVLIEWFERMFGWFAVAADRHEPDITIRIRPDSLGNRVSIDQDGAQSEYTFESNDRAFGFLYARILDQVSRRDPELLCVHAAALSRAGRGIALAAPSQHGKSTLALSLSARGFTFLSDEVAPIHKSSLALLPFPMAISCRPGTYELLHGTEFENHAFEPHPCSGKTLYEPSVGSRQEVEPVPLHAVFFVEPGRQSARGRRQYRLFLDRPVERLVPAIAAVDGVVSVRPESQGRRLVLEIDSGAWVAPAVEGLLEREQVMVSVVEDLDAPKPDFDAAPELSKLSTTVGVLGMFRHLRGFGAIQDLARSTPDGFSGLLVDLAERMRSVGFYSLTPGRLPSMVEAIESVVPS